MLKIQPHTKAYICTYTHKHIKQLQQQQLQ